MNNSLFISVLVFYFFFNKTQSIPDDVENESDSKSYIAQIIEPVNPVKLEGKNLDSSYGNRDDESSSSSDDVDDDSNHQRGINVVTSSNIATTLSIPDGLEIESDSKLFTAQIIEPVNPGKLEGTNLDSSYGNRDDENSSSSDDVDIDANHQWGINAVTSSNIVTTLTIPDDVESESDSNSFTAQIIGPENPVKSEGTNLDSIYGNRDEENLTILDDVDVDATHHWGINAASSSNAPPKTHALISKNAKLKDTDVHSTTQRSPVHSILQSVDLSSKETFTGSTSISFSTNKKRYSPPERFEISAHVVSYQGLSYFSNTLFNADDSSKQTERDIPFFECGTVGSTTKEIPLKHATFRHFPRSAHPESWSKTRRPMYVVALHDLELTVSGSVQTMDTNVHQNSTSDKSEGEVRIFSKGSVILLDDINSKGHKMQSAGEHEDLSVLMLTASLVKRKKNKNSFFQLYDKLWKELKEKSPCELESDPNYSQAKVKIFSTHQPLKKVTRMFRKLFRLSYSARENSILNMTEQTEKSSGIDTIEGDKGV